MAPLALDRVSRDKENNLLFLFRFCSKTQEHRAGRDLLCHQVQCVSGNSLI